MSIPLFPVEHHHPLDGSEQSPLSVLLTSRPPARPETAAISRATVVSTVEMEEGSVRALLNERRQVLAGELARLTELPPEPVGNLSFGKRIGDGTTEAVERISTTAAARSIAASIADIDLALEKLTDGTYGRCDQCGKDISGERMEAVPWAAYCVTCSARRRPR